MPAERAPVVPTLQPDPDNAGVGTISMVLLYLPDKLLAQEDFLFTGGMTHG